MKCREARKINYLSERLELVTQERFDAKSHVNECRECREFVDGERAFGSMLRNAVRKEAVPDELKARILGKKQPERIFSYKAMYAAVAIAASVLIVAVGGIMFKGGIDQPLLAGKFVEDHVKFLPASGAQIVSSAPDEIRAWFRGKVDFPVAPPEIHASLKGGRLCRLDKKRLALLFYEHEGSQISLFITDEMDPEKIKIGKEVEIGGRRARIIEDRGYNLLMWQERGLTYSLVSELSIEEIKKLI